MHAEKNGSIEHSFINSS